MEYVQERVTTLHDFGDANPAAPVDRTAVVVPLACADHGSPATQHVFSTLERIAPKRVVVPLRAPRERVIPISSWLESFDLSLSILWCNAPEVDALLGRHGVPTTAGKGRDVWLALGIASDSEYIVVHDADAESYDETHVPRLLFPLANGFSFSKGYYARVESDGLYGRLCRLFVSPLLSVLAAVTSDPLPSYLSAFRYPLAGECALTGALARQIRPPVGWGLEIATLADVYAHAGVTGSAQVDLGIHRHEHRPVAGVEGLGRMSAEVGDALFARLEAAGIDVDYDVVCDRYRDEAMGLIDQYAVDAAFNDLPYDLAGERAQVETYAEAISPPAESKWVPAWDSTDLDPDVVRARSEDGLATLQKTI